MKIDAAPHYRVMAGIMLMAFLGCLIYVYFNPEPIQSHSMILPFALLLIIMVALFIPYYLDHAGVTYEVNDTSVILWRKGNIRKEIQLSEVTTVRNDKPKKSIILKRKGLWRRPIYLHPKSDQDQLFEAINKSAEQGVPPYAPQAARR